MDLTPVKTGQARGAWSVTTDGSIPKHDRKRRAPEALTEGRAALERAGVGDKLTISNAAAHAPALEFGLPPHRAHGMARKAAAAVPASIRKHVQTERDR